MEAIFQKIIASDFSDLAGLTADASIPMSEALLNEIIAAAIEGDQTIQSCLVAIHEQNRISVRLKIRVLPWTLHLKLKLDKSLDFASFSSPKIRMWLENHHLLSSMGSFFNAFPEWAKLYGNQVVIDIGALLRTPAEQKLFGLVKSVDIRTEEGKAIFDVKIGVDF
jgi:hypothetical protein